MGVTVNGSVGGETHQTAVTTKDYTFTVSSGSNLALVLTLNFGSGGTLPTGVTAVWDQGGTNQSMTQLVSQSLSQSESVIFGLRNPAVVAGGTLRVSWTNTAEVFIAAICLAGVDQASDAAAFPHTAAGTGSSTISITSASGNIVVGCQGSQVGAGSTTTGTTIYADSASGSVINAWAEYDAGAASVSIGISGTAFSLVAVDVAAAASGGTVGSPIFSGGVFRSQIIGKGVVA